MKTPNDFGTRGDAADAPGIARLARRRVRRLRLERQGHCTGRSCSRRVPATASAQRDEAAKTGPIRRNDLYWRFDRRRLSAEEIRDSLLAASGQLDRNARRGRTRSRRSHAGTTPSTSRSAPSSRPTGGACTWSRCATAGTRSSACSTGPTPTPPRPQRQTTTVPTQALYFLNDPFFHRPGGRLADRAIASRTTRPASTSCSASRCSAAPTEPRPRDVGSVLEARHG